MWVLQFTGDVCLLALKLLQKSTKNRRELMNSFIDGLLAVCEGQAYDKEFESKDNVTIDEYIKMIDLKTGYLIGLSAELGGSAGVDQTYVKYVHDYGDLLGVHLKFRMTY